VTDVINGQEKAPTNGTPFVPEALYARLKRHRGGGGGYLPDFIARRKELTPAEKLVLGRIWGLAFKSGKFWEHPEGTAEALGLSERKVHEARAKFEDLGLIKEYWRRPKDGRRYFILLIKHEWLEEWKAHVLEQKQLRECPAK
jgi:hypothetical protein